MASADAATSAAAKQAATVSVPPTPAAPPAIPVKLVEQPGMRQLVFEWPKRIDYVVTVAKGERVELVMRNTTMMSHPMHLHGPSFQVTEINGQSFPGAVRDTVLVTPRSTVKVVLDADNPGLWAFHCHNLYHMEAGMFTTLVYRGFS